MAGEYQGNVHPAMRACGQKLWHATVQGLRTKQANKEMKVKTYCHMYTLSCLTICAQPSALTSSHTRQFRCSYSVHTCTVPEPLQL